MRQDTLPDFIIIDDDRLNNLICLKIIKLTIPGVAIQTFTQPEKGLEYILSTYTATDAKNVILFLDINMSVLTGWEVLKKMNDFPEIVKERLTIVMLSSSVAPDDKEKAGQEPLVSGYLAKPLSQAKLRAILSEWQSGVKH